MKWRTTKGIKMEATVRSRKDMILLSISAIKMKKNREKIPTIPPRNKKTCRTVRYRTMMKVQSYF